MVNKNLIRKEPSEILDQYLRDLDSSALDMDYQQPELGKENEPLQEEILQYKEKSPETFWSGLATDLNRDMNQRKIDSLMNKLAQYEERVFELTAKNQELIHAQDELRQEVTKKGEYYETFRCQITEAEKSLLKKDQTIISLQTANQNDQYEIQRLKKEVESFEQKLKSESEKTAHYHKISEEKETIHASQMAELQKSVQSKINTLEKSRFAETNSLKEIFQKEKEQIVQRYTDALSEQRSRFEDRIEALNRNLTQSHRQIELLTSNLTQSKQGLESLARQLQSKEVALRREHDQISNLSSKYVDKIKSLEKEVTFHQEELQKLGIIYKKQKQESEEKINYLRSQNERLESLSAEKALQVGQLLEKKSNLENQIRDLQTGTQSLSEENTRLKK